MEGGTARQGERGGPEAHFDHPAAIATDEVVIARTQAEHRPRLIDGGGEKTPIVYQEGEERDEQHLANSANAGRWSRLAADLLALQLGQERFTWGRGSIVAASQTRQDYVRALKAADAGDMALLLAFART